MGRYEPLTRYLEGRRETEASMSFEEIEAILNRSLPPSARQHQPWWANTTTHSHADSWLRIGWKTRQVDLAGQRVVFVREADGSRPARRGVLPAGRRSSSQDMIAVRIESLSIAARSLLERHMAEHGATVEQAVCDILHQAATDRKRRIIEQFALTGVRSNVDSVDLIREDRDAR
jgi:hypothetical protein